MDKSPPYAMREAVGCFCMTILGGIMVLGGIAVILPNLVRALTGQVPDGLGRSALIWLVAPATIMTVTAWLTFGFRRARDRPRRR